jgi:23S rRNA (cytidine1920-2'-O)/16S rRNA (cytidine1409-2'-O)-methyltransferase
MRLDSYLSKKFSNLSRNQIQSLLKDGKIKVDGKVVTKSSIKVIGEPEAEILKEQIYVGRGGDKLAPFLEKLQLDISNKTALDIGASTGGFTEVLLHNGIGSVVALDVGTLQLHKSLREDPRVESVENMDIREFQREEKFELITCDVSFISLHSILESIDRLAGGDIILLFKPQFEVGREVKRDSRGVILDSKAREDSEKRFLKKCEDFSWRLILGELSQIMGKEGNQEKFFYFQK